MSEFLWQTRAALVVAKKNAMVYYLKPPVFTFGIIFPFFFYLAFAAGRNAPPETMAPGIVAMALFFTASAVGPLVTPWERQAKTDERLITSPASVRLVTGPPSPTWLRCARSLSVSCFLPPAGIEKRAIARLEKLMS